MKKLSFLLLAALPLMAFVYADWTSFPLDDRVTIDFPGQCKRVDLTGKPGYQYDVNGDARCVAVVFDLIEAGMDSAMVAAEMDKPDALGEFRIGILEKMEGSTLISESRARVSGKTAFDFAFTQKKVAANDFNQMYNRNVFIGSKMYVLYFYQNKENPQEEIKKRFMESFKVK